MGQITQFTPKSPGEKFLASEYMQFVTSINNIEKALDLTAGTSNAQIPSTNLAGGIPGSKIDATSALSIAELNVLGPASINGIVSLGSTGSLVINNGTTDIITIGPSSFLSHNGATTTFKIDSDGNVSLTGHVDANDSSILRGTMYIDGGNVANTLTIGGSTGIALDGANKAISVETNGRINAGNTYLDNTGLHMLSGDIKLKDASGEIAFSVGSTGELFASNANIKGIVEAASGTIGGIPFSSTGISATNLTLSPNGKLVALNANISGIINATSGTLGNLTVNGTITGNGYKLSSNGIEVTKGNINLGNGSFVVNSLGELTATNVNLSGHINAVSGNVSGTFTAGSVTLSDQGIHVGGSKGIVVDSGSIEVWTEDTIPEKVLTLGKYTDGLNNNYGILVQDSNGKTFSVNRAGNVFIKGIVSGDAGSQVTGHIVAETGEFYNVNIKGSLSVQPGGSIIAGTSVISDTGIALNSGTISIGNNFRVDEEGNLSAVNANVKGAIEATSGKISGVLSIGNDNLILDGSNGRIVAGGTVLDGSGITIQKGYINLGLGNFSVDNYGTLIAQRATIKGHLQIDGAKVLGTIDAGEVLINQTGIIVKGSEGIKVSSGNIKVLDHQTEREVVTIGSFEDTDELGEITQEYGIRVVNESLEDTFKVSKEGNVYLKGILHGTDGTFSGEVNANQGTFSNVNVIGEIRIVENGSIIVGDTNNPRVRINKDDISINSGTINISSGESGGSSFSVNSEGVMNAEEAIISGNITAKEGFIGGITIDEDGIYANYDKDTGLVTDLSGFYISNTGLIKASGVDLSGTINAKAGYIGGITIKENQIEAGTFSLTNKGILAAEGAEIGGIIKATSGHFGEGVGQLKAGSAPLIMQDGSEVQISGIWTGSGVGAADSSFWISSERVEIVDKDGRVKQTIEAGDAFFKGSVSIDSQSVIDNEGDLLVKSGSIIAGDGTKGHVRLSCFQEPKTLDEIVYEGPVIYAADSEGSRIFSVTTNGAYIRGAINASSGSIDGKLTIGANGNVYIDGNSGKEAIYLFSDKDNSGRVVRLNNLGLYISEDGGMTYNPALTGGGITANAITDGFLTISDYAGNGASGVIVKKWNGNKFKDKVIISPDGITVLDGSITVYSDSTGEVLIGGGYLKVGGLDYGVVTSNNYVANGNFSIVSEDFGLKRNNKGEVFLGQAHSSGGAVSNPTYHYVGWPDHGERGRHEVWTYVVQPDGNILSWDPSNTDDPNKPVMTRATFNPQWTAVHPFFEYCVVPNDACNWIIVLDKDGHQYTELLSWKGGLFGADFTPDGSRLVVAGDDIDRKRGPWDVSVFDTSDPDPKNWFLIGYVLVGEFPCKVVCDDKGYAYVTVSTDNTVYKININTLRVEKVLTFSGPTVPQPITISKDYNTVFVGGVVSDYIHVIPADFNTPVDQCEKWSVLPTPSHRGITHDLCLSPDGRYIFSVNASITDGNIVMIDTTTGEIIDHIDGGMKDRLAIPDGATEEEIERYNFLSATTMAHHPTLPIIYISVTNRCAVSIIQYGLDPESGDLIEPMHEINRIAAGSNTSGISISVDGTRLYSSNHHYHTYPLGANRIWSYDSDRNYYDQNNPEPFDTTQYFYHHNPAGMVLTNNDTSLWVANKATNKIDIIDITSKTAWVNMESIEGVGQNPYALKATPSRDKIIVTNDDVYDQIDPDFISIIDVASKTVEGKIFVGDRPIGLEILEMSASERYLFVACHDSKLIQKISLEQQKVIESLPLDGSPRYLKIIDDRLFITSSENNKIYIVDLHSYDKQKMELIAEISTKKDPAQLALANNNLYVTCQGADCVQVFDVDSYSPIDEIKVGSVPKPIGYNKVKNLIYVGNAGEGSCCIIDPEINKVTAWVMTGFSAEYIAVANNGNKWYVSCHGPKDIVSYGEGTPYTGDAYLDSDGKSHKYGAAYWVPNRSDWHRAEDNTLTGFASVEFWPQGVLQDKNGYAHLTVMGVYDAFAEIEQDVYTLNNYSDGASEVKTELVELVGGDTFLLAEDVADFQGRDPDRTITIFDAKNPSKKYIENADFVVDYFANKIRRYGPGIPSRAIEDYTLRGTTPVELSSVASRYNTIEVRPQNEQIRKYTEGIDYVIDYTNNTIARTETIVQQITLSENTPSSLIENGNLYKKIEVWDNDLVKMYAPEEDYVLNENEISRTTTSSIPNNSTIRIIYKSSIGDGEKVSILFKHMLLVRYYYHPMKRNYTDLVLSADFYWRWPRPENQYVSMEIDELVPKFVIVDNEQIDPFTPIADNVFEEYKGLTFSSKSNRSEAAIFTASSAPIEGSIHDLVDGTGYTVLPGGEQYIEVDMGASYYINEIEVTQSKTGTSWEGVKVMGWDGKTYDESRQPVWAELYNPGSITDSYSITFDYVHTDRKGNIETYKGPKILRSIRFYSADPTSNRWEKIKIMGDWKVVTSYRFASNTLWDSEGIREEYINLNGTELTRFDNPPKNYDGGEPRVRYRTYYESPDGSEDRSKGYVQVWDYFDQIQYEEGKDYVLDRKRNKIARLDDGRISDGERVRVIFKFVQEDLSNTTIPMQPRDPVTGKFYGPGSVAETDITGAWIEWEFENEYRADWYVGWVSDIGMGEVGIFVDDEMVHRISQASSRTERFSQITNDLTPGKHKIRIEQQQGKVNFDRIKLEDFQLVYPMIDSRTPDYSANPITTTEKVVASPSTNPVELFGWYTDKISPGKTRKYLGKGAQIISGGYDAPRVDKITKLPNREVPLRYRVRFSTSLKDRGTPDTNPNVGSGGELGDREAKFERGSVLVTAINFEEGVNPTYWRSNPSADKHPGYMIESWDKSKPRETGIQEWHLANGSVTSSKLKSFSVKDIHIDNNADIQESKLLLNYPTHPHHNKNLLDSISGWGKTGTSTVLAREDHTHQELVDKTVESWNVTGDLKVEGSIKHIGMQELVHSRLLFGVAGDLEFQSDNTTWTEITKTLNPFSYAMPQVKSGAKRYYRLYVIFVDNLGAENASVRIRLRRRSDSSIISEFDMGKSNSSTEWHRDWISPAFQVNDGDDIFLEAMLQNDYGTYTNPNKKVFEVHYAELRAYDVYEQ